MYNLNNHKKIKIKKITRRKISQNYQVKIRIIQSQIMIVHNFSFLFLNNKKQIYLKKKNFNRIKIKMLHKQYF